MIQVGESTFMVQKGSPDANIFVLLAAAQKVVRKQLGRAEAERMLREVERSESYDEALRVIESFGVEFISV